MCKLPNNQLKDKVFQEVFQRFKNHIRMILCKKIGRGNWYFFSQYSLQILPFKMTYSQINR